jgi:5-deoxy-5-amino-3-dehydroquinate synthase
MVTDVAGFTAATYHRGIAVMHVATSLLAMVDAAVGGKTGVNIPEGKNLIGAFWQPVAVACDTDALASLPPREARCGAGEMAKYHFIARENLAALTTHQRIARSVEIKARIVEADERESGERALLNYGHTLAHALETLTGYSIAHGEAVSLGLLYAAHLARTMGRITDERVEEHYDVVHGVYDLRLPVPGGFTFDDVLVEMGRDKKALGSLTFVLDSDVGLQVVPGVQPADARAAWDAFLARHG